MDKPDCYKCKHKGNIPGNAQIDCNHPKVGDAYGVLTSLQSLLEGENIIFKEMGIKGNPHGIKEGWFMWPINFDPVWLESCNSFEENK